jgi:hypothetical protein
LGRATQNPSLALAKRSRTPHPMSKDVVQMLERDGMMC